MAWTHGSGLLRLKQKLFDANSRNLPEVPAAPILPRVICAQTNLRKRPAADCDDDSEENRSITILRRKHREKRYALQPFAPSVEAIENSTIHLLARIEPILIKRLLACDHSLLVSWNALFRSRLLTIRENWHGCAYLIYTLLQYDTNGNSHRPFVLIAYLLFTSMTLDDLW